MTFEPIHPKYENALRDESRCLGRADFICFPETAEVANEAVLEAVRQGLKIKVQGARTGLTGSAVPSEGLVLSGERLKEMAFNDDGTLHVGSGVTLLEIEAFLRKSGKVFPPNPTEKTATVGGMFGVNAMGLDGVRMSQYLEGLVLLRADGNRVKIRRGESFFDEGGCKLPWGEVLDCQTFGDTGILKGGVPLKKMDLIDFLCGTEGTLGMALSFDLRLEERESCRWGVVYFMNSEALAAEFVMQMTKPQNLKILEYFDQSTLELLSKNRESLQALKALPVFPEKAKAAVYAEFAGDDGEALEALLFEQMDTFEALGGSEEMTWAADEGQEIERFRALRHCVIEVVNTQVDSLSQKLKGLTRISADFAGPPEKALEYLDLYRSHTKDCGFEVCIYGTLAQNRLHVSFLPNSPEAVSKAREMVADWAKKVATDGGQIVTENGIGHLKRDLAEGLLDAQRAASIAAVKRAFDPEGVFV